MKTHHDLHLQGGAAICPIHNAWNPPLKTDVCVEELPYFCLKCFGLKYTCMKHVGDTGIYTFCRYAGPTITTMIRWWMHCRSMSVFLCSSYRAHQSSVQKFWTNHLSWLLPDIWSFWQMAAFSKDCRLLLSLHKTRPKDFSKRKLWVEQAKVQGLYWDAQQCHNKERSGCAQKPHSRQCKHLTKSNTLADITRVQWWVMAKQGISEAKFWYLVIKLWALSLSILTTADLGESSCSGIND